MFPVWRSVTFSAVTIGKNKDWKIVEGLALSDYAKEMLKITGDELVSEKAEAMEILGWKVSLANEFLIWWTVYFLIKLEVLKNLTLLLLLNFIGNVSLLRLRCNAWKKSNI